MKSRLKSLSRLNGKKRYLVFGLLAVELLSLPAAAKIVQSVSFDADPIVIAAEINTTEPGISRFLVTSDGGFSVKANNLVGDVKVNVFNEGKLAENVRFGESAQLPGLMTGCAQATDHNSNIYLAKKKTAARAGTAPERAVMFKFEYDPDEAPQFEFVAGVNKMLDLIKCEDVSL